MRFETGASTWMASTWLNIESGGGPFEVSAIIMARPCPISL